MKISTLLTIFFFAVLAIAVFFGLDFGFNLLSRKSSSQNIGGLFFILGTIIFSIITVRFLINNQKTNK